MSAQPPLFPLDALPSVLPDLDGCGWLRFVSVEPTENRFRFYTITWQKTLWDEWTIRTTWGRIGGVGRSRVTYFDSENELRRALLEMVARRIDRGYRFVLSGTPASRQATRTVFSSPLVQLPHIHEQVGVESRPARAKRRERPSIAMSRA